MVDVGQLRSKEVGRLTLATHSPSAVTTAPKAGILAATRLAIWSRPRVRHFGQTFAVARYAEPVDALAGCGCHADPAPPLVLTAVKLDPRSFSWITAVVHDISRSLLRCLLGGGRRGRMASKSAPWQTITEAPTNKGTPSRPAKGWNSATKVQDS